MNYVKLIIVIFSFSMKVSLNSLNWKDMVSLLIWKIDTFSYIKNYETSKLNQAQKTNKIMKQEI